MSRVDHLRVEIYNDVAGKPYIILEGGTSASTGIPSAPAIEVKMWADTVEVVDYRRAKE
jgi:hypothetical protein